MKKIKLLTIISLAFSLVITACGRAEQLPSSSESNDGESSQINKSKKEESSASNYQSIDSKSSSQNSQISSTQQHEHTFSNEWSYNDTKHWHPTTCGHDARKDEEDHAWNDVVTQPTGTSGGYTTHTCSTCGYSYRDSETNPLTYTITWKNWDGTILETDRDIVYGSVASYDGANPTRNKDAQYTYTFSGWSPTIKAVTSDATYTAQYSTTTNKYTITWKNYDGTILEASEEIPYGTVPTYGGTTPTRVSDDDYSYTFNNWSPNISAVSSDATYTAQYSNVQLPHLNFELSSDGTFFIVVGLGSITNKNISIPSAYHGLPVKEISDYAFENCSEITSVIIPTSVTKVGNFAFKNCRKLKSLLIKNPTSQYGRRICEECPSLEELEIPSLETNIYELFSQKMIFNEQQYSQIVNKDGYLSVCSFANQTRVSGTNYYNGYYYYVPEGLAKVTIHGNIPDNSFSDYKLISSQNYWFISTADNSPIETIVIGDNCLSIGKKAFYGNITLNNITFGNNVTSIGSEAFSYCGSIQSINLNQKITSIGEKSFYASSLTAINIPDSVVSVGESAFDSSKLESITLGKGLTTIGTRVFRSCRFKSFVIPNNIISIGENAFEMSYIESLTIPDSVATIGSGAFIFCSSLKSVKIGSGVSVIESIFRYSSNLESVIIPETITSIKGTAFDGCSKLSTVFYKGNAQSWNSISIGGNEILLNATRYYYSEVEPTESGNYWHYDVDGEPIIWN